jgi:hypothetical protein
MNKALKLAQTIMARLADQQPEHIAQWVIDNRYPKSENDKVSDF